MCIVLHSFFVMAQKMMGMQHARFCMCGNTLSSVPICHPSKHASAMLGLVTCLLLLHAMTCICAQHLGPALGQERHQGADCGRQLLPGVERAGPKRAGDRQRHKHSLAGRPPPQQGLPHHQAQPAGALLCPLRNPCMRCLGRPPRQPPLDLAAQPSPPKPSDPHGWGTVPAAAAGVLPIGSGPGQG